VFRQENDLYYDESEQAGATLSSKGGWSDTETIYLPPRDAEHEHGTAGCIPMTTLPGYRASSRSSMPRPRFISKFAKRKKDEAVKIVYLFCRRTRPIRMATRISRRD